MFVLKSTCRKGLHRMVGDSYRLEMFKAKSGRRYVVRRCRACQSDRSKSWYRKKQEELREQDPV